MKENQIEVKNLLRGRSHDPPSPFSGRKSHSILIDMFSPIAKVEQIPSVRQDPIASTPPLSVELAWRGPRH